MDAPQSDDGGMRQFAETEESGVGDEQAADQDDTVRAPSAPAPSAADAGDLPTLRDEAVPLAGEAAVRARYEELAEASAVLGEPVATAGERAVAARTALAGAPAFRTGVHPGACLDEGDAGVPAVPVLVESAVLDGRSVLVSVVVTASPGASTLDRVAVQVRASADCAPVLDVDVG